MNVADVIRRVQRVFGDNTEAQIYVTDLLDWITDAQTEIVRNTQALQGTTTFAITAGTEEGPFSLPADFLFEQRVSFKDISLVRTSLVELDSFNQSVDRTTSGAVDVPSFYYIWGNALYLYPPPKADASQVLKIWYVKNPVAVTSSSDPLTVPSAYHEDVVRYCLMRAHELNENYTASDRVSQDFQTRMSVSRDQAQNPSDSYPVVRDYAGDYSWESDN